MRNHDLLYSLITAALVKEAQSVQPWLGTPQGWEGTHPIIPGGYLADGLHDWFYKNQMAAPKPAPAASPAPAPAPAPAASPSPAAPTESLWGRIKRNVGMGADEVQKINQGGQP